MSTVTRTARIDVRLREDEKLEIEEAAARLGQSLSEFAVSVLLERSRAVMVEQQRTSLSARDRDLFIKMLDCDTANKALRRAARIYNREAGGR